MAGAPSTPTDTGKDPGARPRDSATLVVVDTATGEPRLLMGRRRATQVFMPNKVVFPGGRVDEADRTAPAADELAECEVAKLLLDMKGRPSALRARAMALAAIRETFEETGIVVGLRAGIETPPAEGWRAFAASGHLPALTCLSLFARAITPPGRPRRYDTRFFCVSSAAIATRLDAIDDELSEVSWYTIAETAALDLPPITRVIIQDLADRLKAGPLGPSPTAIPFYHQHRGNFRRDLLMVE